MIPTDKMLLVADSQMSEQLGARLPEGSYVRCSDAYDALEKMSRYHWGAIVLTAPRPDFTSLVRASRRLQKNAKLFAVCPPGSEPEVRTLTGKVLDEYFIYPPNEGELRRMSGAASVLPTTSSETHTQQTAALEGADFTAMIEAARTIADLESHIAEAVSKRCKTPVVWMDANNAPADFEPLLFETGDSPRVLVPKMHRATPDPTMQRFLSVLQDILPALLGAARRNESLHRLAITDHLTGVYNRRYFYHMTGLILSRTRSEASRVNLLLFDIDDFKRYNDTYGHAAGDEILRETAHLIRSTTRDQDIVARIGGDEFAVLFWDTSEPRKPSSAPPESIFVMAERFRQAVARHEFPSLGPEARGILTISGGLASFPSGGQTCRQLLRTADRALRSVKENGKNAIKLIGR